MITENDTEYPGVPPRFFEALKRYTLHQLPTGSFLHAVLCNDLFRAMGRGDEEALRCLPDLCKMIWNALPIEAWGSEAKVDRWLKGGDDQ